MPSVSSASSDSNPSSYSSPSLVAASWIAPDFGPFGDKAALFSTCIDTPASVSPASVLSASRTALQNSPSSSILSVSFFVFCLSSFSDGSRDNTISDPTAASSFAAELAAEDGGLELATPGLDGSEVKRLEAAGLLVPAAEEVGGEQIEDSSPPPSSKSSSSPVSDCPEAFPIAAPSSI
eukprot:18075_3